MKNSKNIFNYLILICTFSAHLNAAIYVLKADQEWRPFSGTKSLPQFEAIMVKYEKDKMYCILHYDREDQQYYNLGAPISIGYEPCLNGYCFQTQNPTKSIPGMEILDSIECSDFYVPLDVYP